MIYYFGKPWARVAEEWEPTETPVGSPCAWCEEIIVEGDQGICSSNKVPHHKFCWFRVCFGGANHQMGRCTCCGGTEDSDPPHMTRREAATEAVRVWCVRQGDPTQN
jgi:hypothetical protein